MTRRPRGSRGAPKTAIALAVGIVVLASSSMVAGAKEPYFGKVSGDVLLGIVVFDQSSEGRSVGAVLCNGAEYDKGRSPSFRGERVTFATDGGIRIVAHITKKRVTGTVRLADGQNLRFSVRPGQYGSKIVGRCGASLAASSSAVGR